MSISYTCHHLEAPRAPLPPSYPSSSSSQHPLRSLYFCEECDAIRCDLCVSVEVASYFCPNCLFDVPSANVRGDRNRCARSCFACPRCSSALQVQAAESSGEASSSGPFLLGCTHCRWSSQSVGWEFEKSSGLASQLQRMHKHPEVVQAEFDALKDHLDGHISHAPVASPAVPKTRNPTRHVSHLTQMAAKALHREIPGMAASSARSRPRDSVLPTKERVAWDDLGEYKPKESIRSWGLEHDIAEAVVAMDETGPSGLAELENRWTKSYLADQMSSTQTPERIKLLTKLTKRCSHPSCRHLLIQPDTKTTRMKIKMVAANYLPLIEIGRRRRRVVEAETSAEDLERQRRQRRRTGIMGEEAEEAMDEPLLPGQVLALTNPLYDPIQIRLTQPHSPRNAPVPNHTVHIPTPHFTINALKDAWAYEEEEETADMPDMEGTEMTSESGATSMGTSMGTLGTGKRSRMSLLSSTPAGSLREKKRDTGVEKKGNITKVGLELELSPNATGHVAFDLEVRYTYRDESAAEEGEKKTERSKEDFKTFTFWIRVDLGSIE